MIKQSARDLLIALSVKYSGDWTKIRDVIAARVYISTDEIHELVKKVNDECITLVDDDYPQCLIQSYQPPFVLFYKGNIKILKERRMKLGVVGSRNNTSIGKKSVEYLVEQTIKKEKDTVIVSGMARGIDGIAERTAMRNSAPVISILGSGLDICYPSQSQDIFEYSKTEKGLLITEYPKGVPPTGEHFPMRNRLISAISHAILIGEGTKVSGTNTLVRWALTDGKDVLCVPCDIFSPNPLCIQLIHEGAICCVSEDDIIQCLKGYKGS